MSELNPGQLPASKPSTGKGCLAVIVGGVIFVSIIVLISSISGAKDEPYDPNWSGEAISQCEDLVTQKLKAPATAKFDTNATGDETWIVTGTVDSENSFGATLRADFQCTVIIEGESIKRRLDFLG